MELDIDHLLRQALDHVLGDPATATPLHLAESIRYSLLAPGKRIRPRLLVSCAEMLEIDQRASTPAALSLEMIHCFTLIHDDLPCMDNDDFRRGRPSNHKQFGEPIALLAGDALVAIAVEVFSKAEDYVPPKCFVRALRRLIWAMGPKGVIGGQAAEMLLDENSSIEALERMQEQKTGALFLASLLIPVDFANIGDKDTRRAVIATFGNELGLAFQIADDLADAEQDKGKPISILFHMTATEARNMMLQRLSAASQALASSFGTKAQPLLEISAQVERLLEAAHT